MAAKSPAAFRRRALTLCLERLEPRDLPTPPTFYLPTPKINLSPSAALPQPTAHEQAQRTFVAKFKGMFITGPGRQSDQASQSFISGGGTSSAFLHGDIQMAVYTPHDPSSITTGIAALIVKNVSNSGNLLILDLQGDTQSLDSAGRPTRFTWVVDGNSGGTFTGADGAGTAQIHYWSDGKRPARATSAGHASVIFHGSVNTNGVTNVLRGIL